jgi:hypothetical protein
MAKFDYRKWVVENKHYGSLNEQNNITCYGCYNYSPVNVYSSNMQSQIVSVEYSGEVTNQQMFDPYVGNDVCGYSSQLGAEVPNLGYFGTVGYMYSSLEALGASNTCSASQYMEFTSSIDDTDSEPVLGCDGFAMLDPSFQDTVCNNCAEGQANMHCECCPGMDDYTLPTGSLGQPAPPMQKGPSFSADKAKKRREKRLQPKKLGELKDLKEVKNSIKTQLQKLKIKKNIDNIIESKIQKYIKKPPIDKK